MLIIKTKKLVINLKDVGPEVFEVNLNLFSEKLYKKYPTCMDSRKSNWRHLSSYFKYD